MPNQFPIERLLKDQPSAVKEAAQHLDSFLSSVLTTEDSHPATTGMAEKTQDDKTLSEIIEACTQVDIQALAALQTYLDNKKYNELVAAIKKTLENEGKIYIAGCGSSGRLALFLERICREILPNKVVAVMAGGDFALVRAIEDFEDKGEYGVKQLEAQKFNPSKDLYIGVSASGSAKFNNFAIWEQAKKIETKSAPEHLKPWLICCNDAEKLEQAMKEQDQLAKKTDSNAKSPHPLADYAAYMQCLGLDVGPNALAGSSRMQSATVSELALYFALLEANNTYNKNQIKEQLNLLSKKIAAANFANKLKPFIILEAQCYHENRNIIYRTKPEDALNVFPDLTERSPTFKLPKIENSLITEKEKGYAWCSLSIENVSMEDSFKTMLGREPFSLEWQNEPRTSRKMIEGFDFGDNLEERRKKLVEKEHDVIHIDFSKDRRDLIFSYSKDNKQILTEKFDVSGLDEFSRQMFLKMLLNTHSTLVMGRMNKYVGNLMTNLNVSNAKLFARVVRLVSQSIIGILDKLGLNFFSKQMNIPGIPVNHTTQAIAMTVADTLTNNKTNLTTVGQATQTFLNKAGITSENLEQLKQQQNVASQPVNFDANVVGKEYANVKGNTGRRDKLTAFFKLRHGLPNKVIDEIAPHKTNKM